MPASSLRRRIATHVVLLAFAALALPASALAVGPDPTTPDPAATGPYGVVSTDYALPDNKDGNVLVGVGTTGATGVTGVSGSSSGTLLAMRRAGDVFYPRNGKGPFPVLLFLHGNHGTCQSGPGSSLGLPVDPGSGVADYQGGGCTSGNPQIDAVAQIDEARSYRGYDYLAARLATQGYVVASLDVNDITAWGNNAAESGYLARAEIMSKALDLLGRWNKQAGPSGVDDNLIGRVDLSRVGVMGHSRGGEGVNQFAEYNQTRPATPAEAATRKDPENTTRAQPVPDFGPKYDLKAVFSLAPVDNQGARKPVVSGTNFATLLPYCDGDVYDLEGAPVFERSKVGLSDGGFVAAQYLVDGANHDDFNTVWTEDDANLFGFGDPNCNVAAGPTRLQPAEERQIGLTLIGGFLRRYVGGETQFDPITRGESLPPAACPNDGVDPATGVTCRNVVQTSYVAPKRRLLVGPLTAVVPTSTRDGGDAVTYPGVTVSACTATEGTLLVTTGCGASPNRSYGPQMTVSWPGTGTTGAVLVTQKPANQDISSFGTLSFRVSENYTSPLQLPVEDVIDVALTDTAGKTRTVRSADWSAALEPEPGTTARKQVLNGVRIPLTAFTGVDLTKVRTIALGVGRSTLTGSVQFADLALQEPRATVGPDPVVGTPGPAGTTGSTGPAGAAGTPGADGAAGAASAPGPAGASGADGTSGAPGADGTPGAAGADGTPGAAGVDGAAGTSSPAGQPGAAGATGPAGPAGAAGAAGSSGADGEGGSAATSPGGADGFSAATDRQLRSSVLSRGLLVRARCVRSCRVRFTVSLSASAARKAGLSRRTLLTATRTLRAGQRLTTRLKLTPTARAALRRTGPTTLTLTAVGTSASGKVVRLVRHAALT